MSSLDCNGYGDNPTHLEICTIRSRAQPWLFVLLVRGTNALLCKETFILSSQKSCVPASIVHLILQISFFT